MDNQMKRGLLEVCVLAAIQNGESYGYQIIKEDLHVYICIGNGLVLTQDAEKGAVTAPFSTTVGRMIVCNATVVLRPTLAWDDINAK